MIIYGTNPVLEALRSTPDRVRWVAVQKGKGGKREAVADAARKAGVKIRWSDSSRISRLAPQGSVHNGVVAEIAAVELASIEDLITLESTRRVVVLDEISDSGNVGAILRNAEALGANLVVVPERRGAALSPAVVKASAGAANWIPIVQVTNIAKTLERLKEEGFWIYGADAEGESIEGVSFADRVAIVLGSEATGLRRNVRNHCDVIISIPMSGHVDSLNVSAASAVILWELFRRDTAND